MILLFLFLIPLIQSAENCTQDWQCSEWSLCFDNIKIRTCYDLNLCGTNLNKPIERQSCGSNCVPNWQCTEWSPGECDERGLQTKNCTDTNSCNSLEGKPEEAKSCQFKEDFSWIFIFVVAILLILIFGAIWILIKRTRERRQTDMIYKSKPL